MNPLNLRALPLKFIAIYLFSQIATRFAIFCYALSAHQIELLDAKSIFILGSMNDLISLIYILPLAIPLSCIGHRIPKIVGYYVVIFALSANLLSELSFWDEFGTKYNFIAVDYLIYTQEIIGTLYESLPIFKIILGLGIFSLFATYIVANWRINYSSSKRQICLWTGLFCLIALFLFKYYDSDKFKFNENVYALEMSKNGPYEFFSAFRNNALNYIKFYKTIDQKEALNILRSKVLQENQTFLYPEGIERRTKALGETQKRNIVLIVIESMSAEYMKKFGNTEGITPNLDKLADDSAFFNRLYATGTRTVRGLEALTLGIPPTPGASVVRQEGNDGLFNIGSVLRSHGYDLNFIYGGFSYFDNLESYFGGNGYRVIDRSSLNPEEISFANIWGVADEDILTKALKISDESYVKNRPFFSLIMTTSNHRPYTFPEGRIDRPSGEGRYAAVKYTDYAIGKFIEDAKKHPWFDNTIFVITADHCASSAGKTQLPIEKYHIPLMIYAPKILKPSVVSSLASQIDVPPTILGLLNIDYDSKFMGRDIINFPANRAFISTYQLLGYMKGDGLAILAPKQSAEVRTLNKLVAESSDLIKEAISYYQTSYLLFKEGKMREGQR